MVQAERWRRMYQIQRGAVPEDGVGGSHAVPRQTARRGNRAVSLVFAGEDSRLSHCGPQIWFAEEIFAIRHF